MASNIRKHILVAAAGLGAFSVLTSAGYGSYVSMWQAGLDNNTQSEFGQENGSSNAAPGSATVKDDDWYFAGTYPSPIGTVAADEPMANFERALTSSDVTDRIHFNLTPSEIDPDFTYRLIIDTVSNSAATAIPFNAFIDGVQVFSGSVNSGAQTFTTADILGSTLPLTTGDNTVQITRSAGGPWMQFDFVRMEVQVPEPSSICGLIVAGGIGLLRRRRVV